MGPLKGLGEPCGVRAQGSCGRCSGAGLAWGAGGCHPEGGSWPPSLPGDVTGRLAQGWPSTTDLPSPRKD